MRKLELVVQMSLDGFVAWPNCALDWISISKRDEAILPRVIELGDTGDNILRIGGRTSTIRQFIHAGCIDEMASRTYFSAPEKKCLPELTCPNLDSN